MKLEDVRNIAKSRGVHPGTLSISTPIKTLGAAEGNFDCADASKKGELS